MKLVSVIITTYDGEKNILKAVMSVTSQLYSNLEIIIVDDNGKGSLVQKNTEKIVRNINDSRIKYVAHEKNKNGSAARNTGIKIAQGDYIALLDDDDTFKKDKIKLQMERLSVLSSDYILCYTGLNIHFNEGRTIVSVSNKEGDLSKQVLMREIEMQTSSLLFKKNEALKIGGFDESFKRHQDWEFLDRLSEVGKIACVSKPLVDRYILNRTIAKNPKEYEINRLYYLEKQEQLFNKLSNTDKKYIIFHHKIDILKENIKANKKIGTVKWAVKCFNPYLLVKYLLKYINK